MAKPLLLMILDGFGYNPDPYGNAILAADTPNLDKLFADNPHTLIGASGLDVGLPDGQMGNSEVGHTNIGAGRVVYQELTRISKEIKDGDFFENPALIGAMAHSVEKNTAVHLFGLLSDGGVHSHIEHLFGLIDLAKRQGVTKLHVHAILDGRDTPPQSGADYVGQLQEKLDREGCFDIATVAGRYYAMDRDKRWDRVEKAYAAYVYGEGEYEPDAVEAVKKSYEAGVTNEFVVPVICVRDAEVAQDDSVIFFNFRPDRARELTRALTDPDFEGYGFPRPVFPKIHFISMTEYDPAFAGFGVQVAFPKTFPEQTLADYLAELGLRQLHIAETEKYAHVTFFLNGGVEAPKPDEQRILVPSPKVATYDLQPEMSAYEVAARADTEIRSGKYDVIILNFANCDMVGHTGVFAAAVAAVETVDACVGRLAAAVTDVGGQLLITADHGNAEQMWDDAAQSPHTQHTLNPVTLYVVGEGVLRWKLRSGGRLADVAPTLLALMDLPQPKAMTGRSLLEVA